MKTLTALAIIAAALAPQSASARVRVASKPTTVVVGGSPTYVPTRAKTVTSVELSA